MASCGGIGAGCQPRRPWDHSRGGRSSSARRDGRRRMHERAERKSAPEVLLALSRPFMRTSAGHAAGTGNSRARGARRMLTGVLPRMREHSAACAPSRRRMSKSSVEGELSQEPTHLMFRSAMHTTLVNHGISQGLAGLFEAHRLADWAWAMR